MIAPTIENGQAVIRFPSFDLSGYPLFLKAKALPEVRADYDHESDVYTLSTPARFLARLTGEHAEPEIKPEDMSAFLFDYQRFVVPQALEARRFAIWADCGMGKTLMGLEAARHVESDRGSYLISAPKNVLREWRSHAKKYYNRDLIELKTGEQFRAWADAPHGIAICTHHAFGPGVVSLRKVGGMCLDEAGILKTGGGVIKWNIIKSSKGLEYKLALTATPAPNDVMEYASQAAFLEKIRDGGDTLWTFYSKKGDDGDWEIKPHAREAFFRYMASWSIYLRSPARFGFKDNVRELPPVEYFVHTVEATPEQHRFANDIVAGLGGGMFPGERMGVTPRQKLAQAARGFVYDRNRQPIPIASNKPALCARLADEEASAGRQTIVWVDFDSEADEIAKHLRSAHVILDGRVKSDGERDLWQDRFERGEFPVLITKSSMLGFGGNKQFVGSMVVSGVNDSWERFYQLVRRGHRYGRKDSLRVHVPYVPELEGLQWANTQAKAARFEEEAAAMEAAYAVEVLGRDA